MLFHRRWQNIASTFRSRLAPGPTPIPIQPGSRNLSVVCGFNPHYLPIMFPEEDHGDASCPN